MSASPREYRIEHAAELRRIVLAVAVDAHRDVVAVLEREAEAGLHGAADAEVERQPQDARAARARAARPSRRSSRRRRRRCRAPGRTHAARRSRRPIASSSFRAGTIATRRSSRSRGSAAGGAAVAAGPVAAGFTRPRVASEEDADPSPPGRDERSLQRRRPTAARASAGREPASGTARASGRSCASGPESAPPSVQATTRCARATPSRAAFSRSQPCRSASERDRRPRPRAGPVRGAGAPPRECGQEEERAGCARGSTPCAGPRARARSRAARRRRGSTMTRSPCRCARQHSSRSSW